MSPQSASTLNQATIDQLVHWCRDSAELAEQRDVARKVFFAPSDPRRVEYRWGLGEPGLQSGRFLGFFMFEWRLPTGEHPVDVAANGLLEGEPRARLVEACQGL